MWLKRVVFDRASRLELLAVLFPAYWRWSTSMLLAGISAKMTELLRADSHHRAKIIEAAWLAMATHMDNYQVVSSRSERTVELLPRKRKPLAPGQEDIFNYHAYSNPSSRRTGLRDFQILLKDLRSGSLWRACESLAELWTTDPRPTYVDSVNIFKTARISLFDHCSYGPIRFIRWLAKAEQVTITAHHRLGSSKGSSDWDLLASMGTGAKKGTGASAIVSYQDALDARDELANAIAASGATAAASSTTVAGASVLVTEHGSGNQYAISTCNASSAHCCGFRARRRCYK